MPADFSEYVDLTVFDQDPGDIYLNSIEMARLTLPEFNLRPGTVEDAIFQSMAYIAWQSVSAINRLPDRLMAGILAMMGVSRQDSTPAIISVDITADSYEGATIPAGTLFGFQSTFEDEITEYVFQTIEPLTINAYAPASAIQPDDPYPTGTVNAESLTAGIIPNIGEGVELSVLSPSVDILEAYSGSFFFNGENEDTDSEYLSRCVAHLASLSQTLNKARQVDNYILTNYRGFISKAKTYDLTYGDPDLGDIQEPYSTSPINGSRSENIATLEFSEPHRFVVGDIVDVTNIGENDPWGLNSPKETILSTTETTISYLSTGDDLDEEISNEDSLVEKGKNIAGFVTIFVYGFSSPVSESDKNFIKAEVSDRAVSGLVFHVRDIRTEPLSINIDVVLDQNFDRQTLETVVKASILEYLSPNSFPTGTELVRATELISLVSSIPGVRYVRSINLSPIGDGWLPKIDDDLYFRYKGSIPFINETELNITYEVQ
jgi:hypothetical protein